MFGGAIAKHSTWWAAWGLGIIIIVYVVHRVEPFEIRMRMRDAWGKK
jgi:hypothetical protein